MMMPVPAKEYPRPKETVLDYEWDCLIILDACRHDLFEQVMNRPVPYHISVASDTGEWIQRTFKDKQCKDIIYISGNPWVSEECLVHVKGKQNLGINPFFKIVNVWKDDENLLHGTSKPESVSKLAEMMHKIYPDKKLIVHYMQPHFPFIGKHMLYPELWEPLRKEMWRLDKTIEWENPRFPMPYKPELSVWNVMKEGIVTREHAWKCYEDNLKLVLEEMPVWLKLGKKIVVTADHGEMFLDYGIDGHPSGMRVEDLVKVPWLYLHGNTEVE